VPFDDVSTLAFGRHHSAPAGRHYDCDAMTAARLRSVLVAAVVLAALLGCVARAPLAESKGLALRACNRPGPYTPTKTTWRPAERELVPTPFVSMRLCRYSANQLATSRLLSARHARQGIDYMIGRRLPEILAGLGVHGLDATAETALYNGGSDWGRYWSETIIELRDRLLEEDGPDSATIDAFLGHCENPKWWTQTIAFTAVSGRAPA
jgi:hypothetical protein